MRSIHNTSWVTAHFHLIFGGAVVIMYFAIAYEIWPRLTSREALSTRAQRLQLWLWFVGMMVMSLPWSGVSRNSQSPFRLVMVHWCARATSSMSTALLAWSE